MCRIVIYLVEKAKFVQTYFYKDENQKIEVHFRL